MVVLAIAFMIGSRSILASPVETCEVLVSQGNAFQYQFAGKVTIHVPKNSLWASNIGVDQIGDLFVSRPAPAANPLPIASETPIPNEKYNGRLMSHSVSCHAAVQGIAAFFLAQRETEVGTLWDVHASFVGPDNQQVYRQISYTDADATNPTSEFVGPPKVAYDAVANRFGVLWSTFDYIGQDSRLYMQFFNPADGTLELRRPTPICDNCGANQVLAYDIAGDNSGGSLALFSIATPTGSELHVQQVAVDTSTRVGTSLAVLETQAIVTQVAVGCLYFFNLNGVTPVYREYFPVVWVEQSGGVSRVLARDAVLGDVGGVQLVDAPPLVLHTVEGAITSLQMECDFDDNAADVLVYGDSCLIVFEQQVYTKDKLKLHAVFGVALTTDIIEKNGAFEPLFGEVTRVSPVGENARYPTVYHVGGLYSFEILWREMAASEESRSPIQRIEHRGVNTEYGNVGLFERLAQIDYESPNPGNRIQGMITGCANNGTGVEYQFWDEYVHYPTGDAEVLVQGRAVG